MKKILVIICTEFVSGSGLTTVAMNYYRAMNKEGLQIDFAADNETTKSLIEEISNYASRYIRLPSRNQHTFRYMLALFKIMKDYDVVHIHGNSATMTLELFPAVLRRIPNRIVHCHTTNPTAKRLHKLFCPIFKKMYTQAVAVSSEAGEWIYGKGRFIILNNAIPIEKYCFNNEIRKKVRTNLNVEDDTVVVGHVGKINHSKNHDFTVDIFYEMKKKFKKTKLLLVGDGPLRSEIEEKIKRLGIYEDIIFVGMSVEPEQWLHAMDCFLFPSKWEGFGLALAEAQANGLKCYASDAVPKQTNATDTVSYLSLENSAEDWMQEIGSGGFERMSNDAIRKKFREAKLDISVVADTLRSIYLNSP